MVEHQKNKCPSPFLAKTDRNAFYYITYTSFRLKYCYYLSLQSKSYFTQKIFFLELILNEQI